MTRFVWSGDNLLWELKAEGGNTANFEAESSGGVLYGRVSYFHAGGIDRPLVITKAGRPSVIPHQNWRGQFVLGTYASGALADCAGGETTGCESIPWPGHRTTAWHRESKAPDIRTWYGGLVDGMRDASGQMYMRNRYYDPATGQFTQPDPIGLAGGLNSYGFAAGDPVSFSDPYGLCPFASDPARRSSGERCTSEEIARVNGGTGEPILLDPIIVFGHMRGGASLLRSGWRGLRSLAGRIFGRGSARFAGEFASKAGAREFAAGLGLADDQLAGVNSAIRRATASSTIKISAGEGGSVVVSISRAGRDGHQVIQSTVARDGTKSVFRKHMTRQES